MFEELSSIKGMVESRKVVRKREDGGRIKDEVCSLFLKIAYLGI